MFRTEADYVLTKRDINKLIAEFRELGGPVGILRFNTYGKFVICCSKGEVRRSPILSTQYINGEIHVLGDVLPYQGNLPFRKTLAVSTMSSKCVLAHELAHYHFEGTTLEPNSWRDEIRASYFAAMNFNLSPEERSDLIEFANWESEARYDKAFGNNRLTRELFIPERAQRRKTIHF